MCLVDNNFFAPKLASLDFGTLSVPSLGIGLGSVALSHASSPWLKQLALQKLLSISAHITFSISEIERLLHCLDF